MREIKIRNIYNKKELMIKITIKIIITIIV